MTSSHPLIELKDLSKTFYTPEPVHAVRAASSASGCSRQFRARTVPRCDDTGDAQVYRRLCSHHH